MRFTKTQLQEAKAKAVSRVQTRSNLLLVGVLILGFLIGLIFPTACRTFNHFYEQYPTTVLQLIAPD